MANTNTEIFPFMWVFDPKQEGNTVVYLLPADVRTIWIGIPKEKLLLTMRVLLIPGR